MSSNPLASARFKLAHERPYLAHVLWALIPVETNELGTLAVDKYFRLYYDPAVFSKWSINELMAVLYHEVNHLLRDHPSRGETREPEIFNIAADMEINDDIRDEGNLTLPQGVMYPDLIQEPDGKMAEYYYSKLLKKAKKIKVTGQGPGAGQCGSAAHGQAQDYEQGAPSQNNPGVKPGEAELTRRQVAKDVEAASKSRGTVPGHLSRWADATLHKKVDWRKTLAGAIRHSIAIKSGATDYMFSKMSRRQSGDIIMPSTFTPVPNTAVIVDTSGSMSGGELDRAVTEIDGILKGVGASQGVTVLSVDAAVHTCEKVFNAKKVKPIGGGGTDMRVGIDRAMKMRPTPDVIVVLTDGETPWPEAPPKAKIIIGLINKYRSPETPEYAKTIKIEDEE